MPDFEYHLGTFTDSPTQVSFQLLVRDGTGKLDFGTATVTVAKPLTAAAIRTAILNAANGMISPTTQPQAFIEELLRRMNRGL